MHAHAYMHIIEKLTEKIASLEISKSLLDVEKVSAENAFESTPNKPVNKEHVTIRRKKHAYVLDESDTDEDKLITTYSTLITGFQHTWNENSVEENESEDKSVYINSRKDTSLKNQIKEIRNAKHKIYIEKNKENENDDIANNNNNKWAKNTILITGDSILNNIQQSRISNKFKVKVRAFSGVHIEDMFSYIAPFVFFIR